MVIFGYFFEAAVGVALGLTVGLIPGFIIFRLSRKGKEIKTGVIKNRLYKGDKHPKVVNNI